MDVFRIPRREVHVELVLRGGQEMAGVLYASNTDRGGHPGSLLERLNNESENFIPLVLKDERYLIRKEHIVLIKVARGEGAPETNHDVAPIEKLVRLDLTDGTSLEGLVRYRMPVGRTRLLDLLNARPGFIPLFGSEQVQLVNFKMVIRVLDLSTDANID
jgi:hypothetical protein